MTNALHLPARPGAPIACDMSGAVDTPDERLREYRRLFETALERRERLPAGVAFTFRAGPGTREAVEELARREADCCPFLGHRVEAAGEAVAWTISGPEDTAADRFFDELYALPDAGSELSPAQRAALGLPPVSS